MNADDNFDTDLRKEAITFIQPVLKNRCNYPHIGKINISEYNSVTWIFGMKHFAVIINGEVRYCGINFPYMTMNLTQQLTHEIIVKSWQGDHKVFFREIKISQLKMFSKTKIKKGDITMVTRQSNNILQDVREIIRGEVGENYPLPDYMAFLMERLGEKPKINYWYWIFAGITGDGTTQIYNRNITSYIDSASQYLSTDPDYIKYIFDAVGYGHTYVTAEQINANKLMYIETFMAYIDRGIPVIAIDGLSQYLLIGYEDNGKRLLFHGGNPYDTTGEITHNWIFVGDKKQDISLDDIYRNTVHKMTHWLTLPERNSMFFGAEAFREWADDIENGKYEKDIDLWSNYANYVCNLATNAGNCEGIPFIVAEFLKSNPEYKEMCEKIFEQYVKMSNQKDEHIWKALENLGGGFNVTHEVMRDKEKRSKIADVLRRGGKHMDEVVRILKAHLSEVN